MPDVWGMLPKSQVDPETIEEAIDRKINAHNDDETSHLGVGQSLQSHKASEIIDHVAASIVADKIAKNQVQPEKLSFTDRFLFSGIVSLDNLSVYTQGTGAAVSLSGYGGLRMTAGSAVDDYGGFACNPYNITVTMADEPILECMMNDGQDYNSDSRVCIGASNPFSTTNRMIGFKYKYSDGKVYGYYVKYSGGAYVEVEQYFFTDVFGNHRLRIEVDDTDKTIKWFVQGVLKWTVDYTNLSILIGGSSMFSARTVRKKTTGSTGLGIWNVFFTKKGTIAE